MPNPPHAVQNVLDCLKKALKVADHCVGNDTKHVFLFIEILNEYVFFFEHGVAVSERFQTPPPARIHTVFT
jgi:hypothetical protein